MSAFDWGAFASAAIPAIGSLFGDSPGKAAKKQAKAAWKNQEKAWTRGPQLMVEGARRAGLHPLAVLGGNWSAPMAQVVDGQSGWGDAIGSGLQAVSDGFRSASERRRAQEVEDEVKFQQLLNNLETQRMNDAQIKLMERQGQMYDSEVLLNGARTRSTLMDARHGAYGATGPGGTNVVKVPFTNMEMPVKQPGFADEVQSNYGDIAENVAGIGALTRDLLNYGYDWAKRAGTRKPPRTRVTGSRAPLP